MIPLGYLYKHVADRPEWLTAAHVADVYSLSGCVSKPFADYIDYWKNNGYWLFDSPHEITELASAASISLEGLKLFYYEAYELQFDEDEKAWEAFESSGKRRRSSKGAALRGASLGLTGLLLFTLSSVMGTS